ncbi:DUF4367 domain-containing protein [Dorea formicigenerans]|uniref:DUF4367 domain-containing protein n=1 Tax=Dorea formicigenerans TaxID=39486 RepID=UPI001C00C069|nr:DUF4367 domain-containing protein [Dorea formicigenerans]MBT9741932.1 DUF4367 domain-containing protein [Dorea formicigenerans]
MSEKKDQLKEILKDQLNKEAKQIEEEVGLNDNEEIPNELKIRMKNALDQKIREREKRSEDTNRTDAYAKLSEEDREALRLGREMLKNQSEEKKIYTMRRKKSNIRRIVALAAVLILVMAIGMTSIGGPERMLQFVKSSVGGRQVSKVNSSDKNKIIEEEDEEKAYEKITDEFGIGPVKIIWRPVGMEFEKMELDPDIQVAELDYIRDREKMEFIISASYGEVSLGADNEDEIVDHYYIKENVSIEVTAYKTPETETNRYKAEFKYNNLYYCLTGTMTKEEMENILKNLYFL